MKLLPLTVLTILASILLPFSTMNAYAFNCESTQTGFWDLATTWINCNGTIPVDGDNITIKNGHIVTVRQLHSFDASVTVESAAQLVIDGVAGGKLDIKNNFPIALGSLTNNGKITTIGGAEGFSGEIRLRGADATNECGGIIETNGADASDTGSFVALGITFVNKGTINLNGGNGFSQSGSLFININSQADNHGTINENPGSALNSGIVINEGIFNDNLANLCQFVGGSPVPIDTTSLLLAGSQMTASWMIPAIIAAIGIGIVIARKF